MKKIALFALVCLFLGCNGSAQNSKKKEKKEFPITKTDSEWKAQLSDMQ